MTEQAFGKKYSQFINALIFIFPILINSVKIAGDIVLFILAIIGIFIAISQKLSPFIIKDIKVFSYLTTSYFIAVCLSVLLSGKAIELLHFIPRDFHFLFAPFIALALYKAEINVNYLLTGVKVGLIFIGIIVINQLLSEVVRPAGVMNESVFANLIVSMLFVVIVFFQRESFNHKMLTLLSLLSGFIAIVASGSRGAWLTLLVLLCFYLFFLCRQKTKLSNGSKIIMVLLIAIVLSIGGFNQYVNDRLDIAATEAYNWLSGDKYLNSVGMRLEMYSRAMDNIEDVPFFGHGYRTSNLVIGMPHNHLHNGYLTNYYNGGIVFLGALLLLLLVPFRIFIKAMRQNLDEPVFIAGALLTLGFVNHGMFNVLMGDVFMNGFYVLFLAVFLHLTAKSTKES